MTPVLAAGLVTVEITDLCFWTWFRVWGFTSAVFSLLHAPRNREECRAAWKASLCSGLSSSFSRSALRSKETLLSLPFLAWQVPGDGRGQAGFNAQVWYGEEGGTFPGPGDWRGGVLAEGVVC